MSAWSNTTAGGFQKFQERNFASFSIEEEFCKSEGVRSCHIAKLEVDRHTVAIASIHQDVWQEDDPGRRVGHSSAFVGNAG